MGYRRTPFAVGEWYHCYTRGIDKRTVFENEFDAQRFQQLLYLANDTRPIVRSNFDYKKHREIYSLDRESPLVALGAYCLMKNHYHLLIQEISDGGISRFMQKLGTGYSMYFNERYDRIGNLFVKPFRSKHVDDDAYLRRVAQYIHLNSAEIFEGLWKRGGVHDLRALQKRMEAYPYSSLPDYALGSSRPENAVLDASAQSLLSEELPSFSCILADMHEYYAELQRELKT